jgi:hypothetical protein
MTYEYIAQRYGLTFHVGDRVFHRTTNRFGWVTRSKSDLHYVRVRFDGSNVLSFVHPMELNVLEKEDGDAPRPKKAFLAQGPDDDYGIDVIWAWSNIEARRIWADWKNEGELGGITCRRVPKFDKHEATGVPVGEMIALGCWTETDCHHVLGGEDDLQGPHIGVWGGTIYCNEDCKSKAIARRNREDRAAASMADEMMAWARARVGNLPMRIRHQYAEDYDGTPTVRDVSIAIDWDGGRYGDPWVRLAWPDPVVPFESGLSRVGQYVSPSRYMGPPWLAFMVANGDRDAFEKYIADRT